MIFGWIVAGVCLAALIFGPYAEYKNGDGLLGVDALYNGVSRTLWCIGVMWIILAGNLGHGGRISFNAFVNCKCIPLFFDPHYCSDILYLKFCWGSEFDSTFIM